MIVDFASVLGHRLGYLPNAHPIFAGGAQHGGFPFGHDTQTRHCDRISATSGVLWAGYGIPQRQTSLNGSGDIAV
jgi:hypothetical protein